jgi:ATP-dependent helicase/nuclease subunit A
MELPANYELLEDDAPAKALVWRRFYAALLADAERHEDYLALVFDCGRAQTEKALQTALDKRTEFALADAHGVVLASVRPFGDEYPAFAGLDLPDDFLRARPQRWQTLLEAARALGQAGAKTFSAKGLELEMALGAGDIAAVFKALLTEKDTSRKFSEKIVGIEAVRAAQELLLCVLAARLQHGAWLYQQRMARLSRVLIREFAALKREQGWVDMNDVERAAQVMLSDTALCGWVQERLDARIKHLLIDEFQDTNPLQWQALKSWLSGYAGAGGGAALPSVFIVGDPKQSIYRFRRAEPQVFRAAKAFVREGLQGELLSCDHTRRNASAVIAAVNSVMADALVTDAYEDFRPHTTSSPDAGRLCQLPPIPRPVAQGAGAGEADEAAVEVINAAWRDSLTAPRELPEETLRTLEARQAAGWIAQQLDSPGLQASDVMVLSRKRVGLTVLQDELRRLHIAAQIGEKTNLIECCEVQDMVALLDLLVSPQNDLCLARVLKSPLFNVTDEALVQLAIGQRQSALSWFELLEKTELLTQDGRAPAPCLIRWKSWLDGLPPHDALQAIYSDGDVLARFACAAPASQRDAVLANLRALLNASLQLGGGRFATPYAFVRALKAGGVLAPAAVNPQALRLLTIHGAKGLEAQIVLLLDTDTPERNPETMAVLIDWPGEAAWPQKFVFLASENQPPADAVVTLAAERRERQREELNALYVAMTRARHTLAISSIVPHRPTERSWWQRLAPLAARPDARPALAAATMLEPETGGFGPDRIPAAGQAAIENQFYIKELPQSPVCQALEAINNLAIGESVRFPGVGSSAAGMLPDAARAQAESATARIGQAMHRLLEWGGVSDRNRLAAAREFCLTPEQGGQAAVMALRVLQGDAAWAWDSAVLAWQGNEVELLHLGKVVRLDRLVQRKDAAYARQWWVLDYKSAQTPQDQPALVAQLLGYRAAVQSIYPDAQVRAAFLTVNGKLVELAAGG